MNEDMPSQVYPHFLSIVNQSKQWLKSTQKTE